MSYVCWKLDRTFAHLNADRVLADLDVVNHRGLIITLPDEPSLRLQMLGFTIGDGSADGSAPDAYVRGVDLVATYDESARRPIRAQAYWRKLASTEFCQSQPDSIAIAVELVLSVNTSLLDSDPQAAIETTVAPAVSLRNGGERSEQSLVQLAGDRFSYIELVHPSDVGRSEAVLERAPKAIAQLRHRLFQQRLEKGVILRARVRGAMVERSNDAAVADAAFRQFAVSEPPLAV